MFWSWSCHCFDQSLHSSCLSVHQYVYQMVQRDSYSSSCVVMWWNRESAKNLWQQINISVSIVFPWYPLPASFRIPLSCNVCRRLFEFVRCDVYAKHYTDQRSLSFGVHYNSYQISRHLHDDHHIECQHYTAADLINTLDVFERKK